MSEKSVHGTLVALDGVGALLRGPSGSGKSDLALRFLYLPAMPGGGTSAAARPLLVADDQVILRRDGGEVVASCPPTLAGRIEVRGCGIARLDRHAPLAKLKLIADLDRSGNGPRFPQKAEWETVLDVAVRRIVLDPFEPSAPIKLALALLCCFEEPVD